jgi:hypothetical protein
VLVRHAARKNLCNTVRIDFTRLRVIEKTYSVEQYLNHRKRAALRVFRHVIVIKKTITKG